MGLVEGQVDAMIAQRVNTDGRGLDGITTPLQGASSLLLELGPEDPDENDDRRTARRYLATLVDAAEDLVSPI